jgi:hypothetical protein
MCFMIWVRGLEEMDIFDRMSKTRYLITKLTVVYKDCVFESNWFTWMSDVSLLFVVRKLCDGTIFLPEWFYRVQVYLCVIVCRWMSGIYWSAAKISLYAYDEWVKYFGLERKKHNQLKPSLSNIHIYVLIFRRSFWVITSCGTICVSYCQSTFLPVLISVNTAVTTTVVFYVVYYMCNTATHSSLQNVRFALEQAMIA